MLLLCIINWVFFKLLLSFSFIYTIWSLSMRHYIISEINKKFNIRLLFKPVFLQENNTIIYMYVKNKSLHWKRYLFSLEQKKKQRRKNLSSDSITCTTLYVWYHLINFHWFTYMYLSGYSVLFRSTKPLLFLSTIRPVFDAEENTDHPHCSGIVRPVL